MGGVQIHDMVEMTTTDDRMKRTITFRVQDFSGFEHCWTHLAIKYRTKTSCFFFFLDILKKTFDISIIQEKFSDGGAYIFCKCKL